jgi:hypothetical protein
MYLVHLGAFDTQFVLELALIFFVVIVHIIDPFDDGNELFIRVNHLDLQSTRDAL